MPGLGDNDMFIHAFSSQAVNMQISIDAVQQHCMRSIMLHDWLIRSVEVRKRLDEWRRPHLRTGDAMRTLELDRNSMALLCCLWNMNNSRRSIHPQRLSRSQ